MATLLPINKYMPLSAVTRKPLSKKVVAFCFQCRIFYSVSHFDTSSFYLCTIKNIVNGLIKYPDVSNVKSYRHFKDFVNAVTNKDIKSVIGYFTAPRLHPLLESPKLKDTILEILNANSFDIRFEFYNISHLTE